MNSFLFRALAIGLIVAFSTTDSNVLAQRPTDTVEGTVAEVLQFISGKAGKERDWDEFRSLFRVEAQFTVLNRDAAGKEQVTHFSLEQFVRKVGPSYESRDFFERQLNIKIDEYNGIAQVFQTFEVEANDRKDQGINSFQLLYQGGAMVDCEYLMDHQCQWCRATFSISTVGQLADSTGF
ncbi:MAG: hypothetical protein LAT68_16630 [Cyclobacteriaceae bacterium]|nr:hypothetical protein [Cyclobacteriaceae bacterium]MCH8517928.1 hypothetical protein [Cyclobacteriaceae bacterium]